MLTNTQVWELAERMEVPLIFCNFKDKLKNKKLQYNKSYIVNLENEFDEDGYPNSGSHYVCFQVNKYPNGSIEPIYFDSYGQPQPDTLTDFVGGIMPHNDKDVQSLMNQACGWYCLAFLHFINSFKGRTGDLYTDARHFINLFDDLNKERNHLKNEFVLKHFFRSADPALRKPITVGGEVTDVNTISSENSKEKKSL
jgi:hypothetical protein